MAGSGGAPAGASALAVGVLGPLEVSVGGRPVVVSPPRLRALVAVLALSAPQVVPVGRLAAAVWDEGELPGNARGAVQTYVARLRGLLGAGLVRTGPGGYALCAERGQVDALRFVDLLDDAGVAPDAVGERVLLARALGLWRGLPFEDVRSGWGVAAEAQRLTERYLAAVERRVDLDLAGGGAGGGVAGLAAELGGLTARYPLRESLWVRLLVVLGRLGRQAEALQRYEVVRVRLAEELGVDPGPELQQAYADLLAGRAPRLPGAEPPMAAWVAPRQLPVGAASFTGRGTELATIAKLLGDEQARPAAAIAGLAGVGKSALAIHAAHRLAERFPDGQLYVDLHGATAGMRPLEPLEVAGRLLRALGVEPSAVPAELEEASALFRSRLAGRRLLLVLDNAADAAQVAPLLPATPGCGVLVTSRRALASLDGAYHLHLDVLTADEAAELLGRVAGEARVAAESEAAGVVARWCGYLPLALRIAGARLAARPAWPVEALAGRLADAQRRLDELELADLGVRASLTVSWQQLRDGDDATDQAAATAFGLLGVLDGPSLSVPVAARLLGAGEQAAEEALERLVDAHLLETPAPGRYRLHDLLRLYARELAGQHHPEPVRAAALTRALGFYAATAWNTLAVLRPGDYRLTRVDGRWRHGGLQFADESAALAWLDAERPNLLAAIGQAAATPGVPSEIAIQIAQALYGFFTVRSHWQDWIQANQTALAIARQTGDRAAQAQAHSELGGAHFWQGRYAEALAFLQEGLTISQELGDRRGQAARLNSLGVVCHRQGRNQEALAHHQESLAINRQLGDSAGQAISLGNLGNVYLRQGRYDHALNCHQESLALYRELGNRHGEAIGVGNLGEVYELQGRYDLALAHYRESLAIRRELGNRHGEAYTLNRLGIVSQGQGRYREALAYQQDGLMNYRELGDRHGQAECLRELGVTLQALGRTDQARAHWRQALAIFEQLRTTEADQVRELLADQPVPPLPPRSR